MALTDAACRAAKAGSERIKLYDGEGLQLWVQTTGSKLWNFAYRYNGKQRQLAFGPYPEVGLGEARSHRQRARMDRILGWGENMRNGLYEAADLLQGYIRSEPSTFVATADYKKFIEFVAGGGPLPKSPEIAAAEAQHDANISLSLRTYLSTQIPKGEKAPRLVAIMGGHGLDRKSAAYRLTADIARDLTLSGFLIATGGGPGAMEAGHVSAIKEDLVRLSLSIP